MERTREFTMVAEVLRNEPFDLQEEFNDVEIAETVSHLVRTTRVRGARKKNGHAVSFANLGDYVIKAVNDNTGSFISVSSDATGVSRSLVWLVDVSKPSSDEEDVKNVLEMLNEAYYLAKSCI